MIKNRALISLLILLVFSISSPAQDSKISLEKIWKDNVFSARSVSGIRSMKDGIHYTAQNFSGGNQYLIKYAYKSGNPVDTLLQSSDLKDASGNILRFSDYEFSPNENKVLIATEQESIYRRSSKANYYAYDRSSGDLKPITDFSKGKQQLAAFSPTANKVAFVRDNNLFIMDLDNKVETQVTSDGKWGSIINGAVDWVYEEEFSFHRGFYWSPEGTKIAYYRFDETEVPEFNLTYYDGLYPSQYKFKYPKAGEKNALVQVFVYTLATKAKQEVDIDSDPEQYIPRIKWTQSDDQLSIMRLNRLQNHLEFLLADVSKADGGTVPVSTIYDETAETYIDINDNLLFLGDGKHFLWNSEKDGWNHIYIYDLKGNEVGQITKGNWEVIEFYGVNDKTSTVYFSAAIEDAISQEIYKASFANIPKEYKRTQKSVIPKDDSRKSLTRLTPNSKTNDAYFSNTFDYFINVSSSAQEPYQVALYNSKGDKIRDIEQNDRLIQVLEKLDIANKEFGTFTTDTGHDLNYWMIKPYDFDPSKQYPVMFMIYGGPGSNTVTNSWGGSNFFWHQMLAQQGHIIISIDPRGTMRRGRDFKHSTYLELGKLETEDLISSAKHFGAMDFIDKDRIGIMGWSYGGYMASLAMTKGAEFFSLGIAVAPVTNWRYYDSIYTERFMRTPQENPEGYDGNSPINFVDQMQGDFLLVHGSGDDNVHYQNTMEMVEALVQADKQFDLFIYPDKNHGIYGGNTRYHLYTKMTEFIKENL